MSEKPREFWINPNTNSVFPRQDAETIHVIEHSAYKRELVLAEAMELRRKCDLQTIEYLNEHLLKLQAMLKIYEEALIDIEFCPRSTSSNIISDMQETANRALSRISEMKEKA